LLFYRLGFHHEAVPPDRFDALAYVRALLVLGRVSNLPTVWSNCLAGYILGGGGDPNLFIVLCTGASCVYVGGMYLNDAFDADFDKIERPERPIPKGTISVWKVWCLAFMWLSGGMVILALLGKLAFTMALALLGNIIMYDAYHKQIAFAPVLMGLCRLFLVIMSAAAAASGPDGMTLWCAVALGIYVTGVSFLARLEYQPGARKYWAGLLLFAPVLLALLANDGEFFARGCFMAVILFLWIFYCLLLAFNRGRQLGRAVSGLLAGIALVDMAAVGPIVQEIVLVFPALFLAALILQKVVPAD